MGDTGLVAVAFPSGGSGSMNWLLGLSSDAAQIPQRSSCPVFGRSGVRLPRRWEQCRRKLRVNSRNSDVFKLVLGVTLFWSHSQAEAEKTEDGTAFKVIGADQTDSNMRGFVLGRAVLTNKLQTVTPAD